MTATAKKYYGKYRGVVTNNWDPEYRGRLIVECSDVLGMIPSTWAMPSLPFAGTQSGAYTVPMIGSGVWVEFEHGDPAKPVWTGCWYGSTAEVPLLAAAGVPPSQNIVLQTPGQNALVISDVPAVGLTLKTRAGAMIVINDVGILLSNGKGATVLLAGKSVMINDIALVVT